MGDTQMRLPLDNGFLRRECPTCEREFKWLSSKGDAVQAPSEGYACPYCNVRASSDHWWTQSQLDHARQVAMNEILHPELKKLEQHSQSRSFSLDITISDPQPLSALNEPSDMRRVNFSCHPGEPVKVLDSWSGPVHCLICGQST
ncbi:MAG: hypothetical protein WC558_11325 [Patulibacter sp.]